MEAAIGVNAAAAILFHFCEGEVPDFYSNNDTAMAWLLGKTE
jgi:hypothetical protein